MAARAVHVTITGRVQGVWFRGWTVQEAASRRLAGWVRNRRDGSVEALFQGEDDAVRSMLDACLNGPAMARVDNIQSAETAPQDLSDFRCLPTA